MSQGIMHGDLVCKLREELLMVREELRKRDELLKWASENADIAKNFAGGWIVASKPDKIFTAASLYEALHKAWMAKGGKVK